MESNALDASPLSSGLNAAYVLRVMSVTTVEKHHAFAWSLFGTLSAPSVKGNQDTGNAKMKTAQGKS